jgi:cystathionine beta-lyase
MHSSESIGASTRSLHADDSFNVVTDVAPPMHLSTTFRYSDDPTQLVPYADLTVCPHLSSIEYIQYSKCII